MNEILENIGLSPEESEVYLYLLDKGAQTAIQIGKNTKVKRTYVYIVCKALSTKGLVKIEKQGKTTLFSPLSPDHLQNIADTQRQTIESASLGLDSILDKLRGKYRTIDTKPTVQYFEGIEGVKKVYSDLLKEARPISAIVQTSEVEPQIYGWLTKDFVKKRIELRIPVRAIVGHGAKTPDYVHKNMLELRESKIVPDPKYEIEQEINIYGNKVAIINNKKGSPLLGIIINDQYTAKTFFTWFELTWNSI